MVTVLWLAAPLLVLAGAAVLLSAWDDPRRDLRRGVRFAAGCLAAAVVVTLVGVLLDRPSSPPPRVPAGSGPRV